MGRGVRFSEMWDDDLCIALCAESPRLEQWLQEEYATLIHVQTSFNVVKRVGDTVDRAEEIFVVNV